MLTTSQELFFILGEACLHWPCYPESMKNVKGEENEWDI